MQKSTALKIHRASLSDKSRRWARETEVGTQRLTFVCGAKKTAPLQQRHDFGDKHVEHLRQDRQHQVEPVSHAIVDPVLHQIRHLLRRTLEDKMTARAA